MKIPSPASEKDIQFLQTVSEAILNQITHIRQSSDKTPNPLHPNAHPLPSKKQSSNTHLTPETRTSNPKNHLKVQWDPSPPKVHIIQSSHPNPRFYPTIPISDQTQEASFRRSQETGRRKLWRDQITDLVIALSLIQFKNSGKEPSCPTPRDFYTPEGVIKRPNPHSKLTYSKVRTSQNRITILQRPNGVNSNDSPHPKASSTINPKSLEQRSLEYREVRERLFGKSNPAPPCDTLFPP